MLCHLSGSRAAWIRHHIWLFALLAVVFLPVWSGIAGQLQIQTLQGAGTKTPASYEAMVFIGYDNTSERYVAHWIDVFGGRFSESLGYGTRAGNSIKFVFEYPDGPFHNTFTWNPETKMWVSLLEQKDTTGKWKVFAEDTLRRSQ